MLGNFTYANPTKLYFGEDSLKNLNTELHKYGKNTVAVQLRKAVFMMKLLQFLKQMTRLFLKSQE